MHTILKEIFDEFNIEKYGVCSADKLKPFNNNSATARLGIEAVSVITCLFPYLPIDIPKERNLALYAIFPDYHIIIGDILTEISAKLKEKYPNNNFKGYVDISPINETKAAELCGLGNIGKSDLLINKDYGAFHFIGEIITDLSIEELRMTGEEGCTYCGRCVKGCPLGAIGEEFNEKLCLSYITQKKGELTQLEQTAIINGKLVWGCDNCSFACGITVKTAILSTEIFPILTHQNLDTLMKNRAFAYRGKAVLLRNLSLF